MDNINMLLWYEGDFEAVMNTVDPVTEQPLYPYPYSPVSEMQGNCWMLVLEEKDDFDDLEQALEDDGSDVVIIGTYNMDGTHFIWFNQGQASRNHGIDKYREKLNDVIEYDQDGEPIGSHPPSEAEALATNVNKVYGWGNRVLTDPV